MAFELSEDERMALDSLRRCVETEVLPRARPAWDSAFSPALAHELLALVHPCGIGAGWLPEDAGGMGLSYRMSGLLYGALARLAPDVAGLAYVSEGAAMKIHKLGTEAQKARYLPGFAEGRLLGCGAVTEPGTGSNVRQMRTRAVRDGTGWRLSGEKMFISNATVADVVTLLARTGENRFTYFLLDRNEHDFATRELDKLGLNGWSFGAIALEDLYVEDAFRLGEVGGGLREALSGFERARVWVAVIAAGLARAALDDAVAYACERDQFGVPIAAHQLVQGMLADMACETEAADLLTLKALHALDAGGRADLPASMAKAYAAEAAVRVASRAIQIHGANGVTGDYPVERHFRNARMLTIPDGTTQINQLIVGRELTGVAAFLGAAGQLMPQAAE